MKCLLKYQWVKLPRTHLPSGKGVMGDWARLTSRAAFRNGQARYCGHINEVSVGTWAGGVVGLKSILGGKKRQQVLTSMDKLAELGYVDYALDVKTKKLTYKINDWVLKCSGAPCLDGKAVYATDGYGFLCMPRNITERLVEQGYTFEPADAWLDLWCHTVWNEPTNAFSYLAPAIQFGKHGAALTLETMGQRWNWEKTKVWRFLQKCSDAFTLHKLPGSYGCLIFNNLYPTGTEIATPDLGEIVRILDEIRIHGNYTHLQGTDNHKINRFIAWYSKNVSVQSAVEPEPENRVALFAPIIRAYLSPCKNYKKCSNDCWKYDIEPTFRLVPTIRGPCLHPA